MRPLVLVSIALAACALPVVPPEWNPSTDLSELAARYAVAELDLQRAFESNRDRDRLAVQRALAGIAALQSRRQEESAALSRAAAVPAREPPSERFLPAYPDGEALSFDPPEPIDWESLAPDRYKSFDIDEPPPELLEQLAAGIDMFDDVEIPFLAEVPSSFESYHFYLIGESGIHPLTILSLRGFVRFSFDDRAEIASRIFFGEFLAKLADDAPPTGGFVLRLEQPMPRERRAVAEELTSPHWGQKSVRSSYSFRIAVGGELFSFVRWQPEDIECEYQLSVFRDQKELSWTGYGCDV